ncbi:hypothetical protein, partial [Escherichia coli]|uniref:hypothetical protein n=1 Tax=Escherichia coli TaxID=562 RepID=UPI0015C42DA1
GTVPVFTSDGSLIDFKSPLEIGLKAAGLDFGKFRDESELSGFLTKQDALKAEYGRKFVEAVHANDIPKAEQIREEHRRRFGYELVVSR